MSKPPKLTQHTPRFSKDIKKTIVQTGAQKDKKVNWRNGFKRKEVLALLSNYSVVQIESAVIFGFCRAKDLKPKNNLIRGILEKQNEATSFEILGKIMGLGIILNLENIEKIFELLIDDSERIVNGAVYTPKFLIRYIVEKTINHDMTVCDPACGSGAFLLLVAEKLARQKDKTIIGTIEKNIFGVDILASSIRRTEIVLSLLALEYGEDKAEIAFNLRTANSLSLNWERAFPDIFKAGGFDAIVGNPPFVRSKNIDADAKKEIRKKWHTAFGNFDLFIPFIELGLSKIKRNGSLGYVLPNSIKTAHNSKELRHHLKHNSFIRQILDFNHLQLFNGFMTYTCIAIFDKQRKEAFEYALVDSEEELDNLKDLEFGRIKFDSLGEHTWKLLSKKDAENIHKIENVGLPLHKIAKIRTGLATLRNELYLVNNQSQDNKFYLKEWNGKVYRIEQGITREAIHAGSVKDAVEVRNNKEHIIYPYLDEGGHSFLINEQVIKEKYPECYSYLSAIRPELKKRDRGNRIYEAWYAYGRTQGRGGIHGTGLIFPTICGHPRFVLSQKNGILVYSGYFLTTNSDIEVLSKILNSRIMWYYIRKTSKPYSGGFMSFAKSFVINFSIPSFSEAETIFLKNETDQAKISEFLIKKYGLDISVKKL